MKVIRFSFDYPNTPVDVKKMLKMLRLKYGVIEESETKIKWLRSLNDTFRYASVSGLSFWETTVGINIEKNAFKHPILTLNPGFLVPHSETTPDFFIFADNYSECIKKFFKVKDWIENIYPDECTRLDDFDIPAERIEAKKQESDFESVFEKWIRPTLVGLLIIVIGAVIQSFLNREFFMTLLAVLSLCVLGVVVSIRRRK